MTVHIRVISFAELAAIDGNTGGEGGGALAAGDTAQVINITGRYDYVNVQDSRAELEPFTKRPTSNPGTNSWHLVGTSARIGALAKLTANFPVPASALTFVEWDAVEWDDATFWTVGDPSKLTIPIGVTQVKLISNSEYVNSFSTDFIYQHMLNGASEYGLGSTRRSITQLRENLTTTSYPVTAGDYFELGVFQASGAQNLRGREFDWFSIEAVGFA